MAGGSERHQLDFEPHQAIAHVVPAVLRHALQVWRVSVAARRVPDRVEVGCDFTGQTLAGKLKHLATRQEPALQPLEIQMVLGAGPSNPAWKAAPVAPHLSFDLPRSPARYGIPRGSVVHTGNAARYPRYFARCTSGWESCAARLATLLLARAPSCFCLRLTVRQTATRQRQAGCRTPTALFWDVPSR
jgi:hypothetical protein